MTQAPDQVRPQFSFNPRSVRIVLMAAVGLGILVLVGANAHFVYVAVTSEPACVPHIKAVAPESGQFRAAMPSC